MRLGGVLQAVTEILAAAEISRQPMAEILKDWAAGHRFAGAKDRAFIGNIVYDALRRRNSLSYKMGDNKPQALAYAALLAQGAYNIPALERLLSGDKFAPPPLTAAQKQAWAGGAIKSAPPAVQADIPQWCAASFAKIPGADWVAEGQALSERAPLDLRVNSLKAERQQVQERLAPFGSVPVALTPWALRIAAPSGVGRHPNLQLEPAFQQGWFEVQDCGSQMAAHLCAARPGEQVLDYCAGGGGKVLALAAEMQNSGQIYAHDRDKARLAPIFARLSRAGVRNVQVCNESRRLALPTGTMDCVLLDAPCTGSGTWRRFPDAKWRLTPEILAQKLAEQRQVLAAGADFVRPGGRLVYVTCSLLYEENDAQIRHFLRRNSNFKPVNMRARWAAAIAFGSGAALPPGGGGAEPRRRDKILPHFTPYGLLLSPRQTATDGFFVAVLAKAAA
ncbi:RsmB/NOP family class I SAM-dependent RNA methyltransferase [Candidatus Tokpelaia sp.]|uniref:RsmB/NOP family class I SAM-dependent RNA methyltransferase n=1 Tax=Candidatus Tokpelaia sp. TaxID=2233777 RepID=UPI001239F1A4|nr:RsmB/NOP family class I SAM-dependent RNA methyltransferase [Candidatus Tokpelaia sp.]KAA6405342.1 MFS transporter [Candidatus Tokpelaia sp.]